MRPSARGNPQLMTPRAVPNILRRQNMFQNCHSYLQDHCLELASRFYSCLAAPYSSKKCVDFAFQDARQTPQSGGFKAWDPPALNGR